MADFPDYHVSPTYISTLSGTSAAATCYGLGSSSALTWTANLAVYVPFILIAPFTIKRFAIACGVSANTPNFDIAVYAFSGEKIVGTGSTVKSSTTIQYITATETMLGPGRYYFGFACDTALLNTLTGASTTFPAAQFASGGVLEQSTAFPLPATMAPSGRITHQLYPIVGMTST